MDQAGDSQPQATIVRVTVADRVGVLSNINSSERKKGSPTWGGAPTRRCQWRTISCAG